MTDREKDRQVALRIVLAAMLVLIASWLCFGLRDPDPSATRNPGGQTGKKVPQ